MKSGGTFWYKKEKNKGGAPMKKGSTEEMEKSNEKGSRLRICSTVSVLIR
jgi:hypothetical protein